MKRTRSVASTGPAPGIPMGWLGKWLTTPPGIQTQGIGFILPSRSAAVTTRTTPGIAAAAFVSIALIRAWPCGQRKIGRELGFAPQHPRVFAPLQRRSEVFTRHDTPPSPHGAGVGHLGPVYGSTDR